ncbi:glycogen debranching protein [Muricauda sp. 2012CJ35-5]|uniref:Glycogen debranching protein n=1 Tax=Flagellimonas spongiicola TaxID=2942208 RepID=A0ABT0PS01_9FLAO|nr:glycogen debranching protein [Allomuricauda spongiicola]MCL6273996.1 glycogen debranching protein [Allomuricauda spongiicola]
MKPFSTLCFSLLILSCTTNSTETLSEILSDSPVIKGNTNYLNSPYVTAGDRVYMVGHQNGSFPDLGWHIKGEMGGIWNHPIKLMDGFDAQIVVANDTLTLNNAIEFVNYPMANMHRFEWPEKEIEVKRWQFVPDGQEGMLVQFEITSANNVPAATFEFIGHTDLQPTWLGEETQMIDAKDQGTFENNKWIVKDTNNPWFSIFGSDRNPNEHDTFTGDGNGASNSLSYSIKLKTSSPNTLTFAIAGSYTSKENALNTYNAILENFHAMASQKKQRYGELAEKSKLTIPDKELQQTFEWLKYNCDWLVRTVPEIGTGIGAGIPDYPWWFGVDSEYALKGYMAIGQDNIVNQTIQLLDSVSNAVNGNGKILHEMSTNGFVFNKGNINETPQFASLIWEIYTWNGDKQFLEKYFPTVQKGLVWLMEENDSNGNLFPDGFGMMEIHGLNSEMIDVAAYTQRAFDDASKMAMELDQTNLAEEYASAAKELALKINTELWSDDFGSYADFLGTDEQAIHLIEDAIVRADTLNKPWAIEELETTKAQIQHNPSKKLKPFVLHHNWVVNTPMEMKITDSSKAIIGLDTAKKFTNPFGVFVTGIDRDDSAGKDFGSFEGSKVFSYTGAVMTLPTGVLAVAENNYGRPDDALDYLERMTRTFSYALPGSIYEVSPDYGMMTQAWNIYAYAIPIVQQFFGIQPMASQKKVIITPQMPKKWEEGAKLENVAVADNTISISYKKGEQGMQVEVIQSNPEWTVQLEFPKSTYEIVEGDAETTTTGSKTVFTSTSQKIVVHQSKS